MRRVCTVRLRHCQRRGLPYDARMFIHTVYFWLRPNTPDSARDQLVRDCRDYLVRIPTVRHLWAGVPAMTPREVVDNSYSAGLTVVLMAVALAPLTFFAVRLALERRAGLRDYGVLATEYVEGFQKKWMGPTRPDGEPLVGSADIQSLADLAGGHDIVADMRLFPLSSRALFALAVILVIPYLPLTLTMFPVDELINRLLVKLL